MPFRSILIAATIAAVRALSTTSPWSPAQWRILIDVGRELGTEMPKEWGASGARLVLPVDVVVGSEAVDASRDEVLGRGTMCIRPIQDATFVGLKGEQKVKIGEGGWKVNLPPGGRGHASTLRFWLDVDEATRNDVTLPGGRLYFSARCWREEELERGSRSIMPLVVAAEDAQRRVDAQLSHETGDRRLDGTDPVDTMLAFKDMAELVADRDNKLRLLKDAEQLFPRSADSLPRGSWPGTTEPLAIAPGDILLRRKNLFGDDMCTLGTWQAIPLPFSSQNDQKQLTG